MDLQDFSTLFDTRKHLLFNLLLKMLVNFLLLLHNLLSWVTYIQKVARFITGDTIVSVIISTRQDENCDEAALNEVLFGFSRDFPFQLTNITVVLRTRTYICQGRNVNKYLLKNMERMYKLCKESLWIRSELSENCFHSVVVKIILINYAKKKLIHALAGVKAQNG
jgi:hypothetical protein